MSGRKVRNIVISENEYERLRKNSQQLNRLRSQVEERVRRARREVLKEIQPILEGLHQRYSLAEETIARLSTGLREAEQRLALEIRRQEEELRRLMERRAEELRSYTDRRVEDLREEVRELYARQEESLREVEARVRDLEAEKERYGRLAQDLFNDVSLLFEEIQQNLPHQRFTPGRLEELHLKLRLQENNLASGLSQVAISGLQELYLDLSRLRQEILQKEQEYLLLWAKALEAGEEGLQVIREAEALEEEWLREEYPEEQRQTDFWVKGELSRKKEEIRRLVEELRKNRYRWTIMEVEEVQKRLNRLKEEVAELIEKAVRESWLSAERKRIAENIAAALREEGFTLERKEGFEENDPRRAYLLGVRNFAGDEIVVRVAPHKDGPHLEINTYAVSTVDRAFLESRERRLASHLQESLGHNLGEVRQEAFPDVRTLKRLQNL